MIDLNLVNLIRKLNSLSDEIWCFSEENSEDAIQGGRIEFCRAVTQARIIADASFPVVRETAFK